MKIFETHVIFLSAIALIQGVTECFPVSSSGHLEALMNWWQISTPLMSCAASAGTLGAMIMYSGVMLTQGRLSLEAIFWALKASLPLYFVGGAIIFLKLDRPALWGLMILVSAAAIGWADRQQGKNDLTPFSWSSALLWGLAECGALWPGVSRMGMSLIAGRLLGFSKEATVKFSFLLAIPASAGHVASGVLSLLKQPDLWISSLYVSSLTALISACVLPLAWHLLVRRSWLWIVMYRVLMGLSCG